MCNDDGSKSHLGKLKKASWVVPDRKRTGTGPSEEMHDRNWNLVGSINNWLKESPVDRLFFYVRSGICHIVGYKPVSGPDYENPDLRSKEETDLKSGLIRNDTSIQRAAADYYGTGIYRDSGSAGQQTRTISGSDGNCKWNNGTGCTGTGCDGNEKKPESMAVLAYEIQYRALVENAQDIIFSLNPEGQITCITPQVKKFGFSPDELMLKNYENYILPDDRQAIVQKFNSARFKPKLEFCKTFRILARDKKIRWVEIAGTICCDGTGSMSGIYGIMRDVTERKKAEYALQEANKKLFLLNSITRHDILNNIQVTLPYLFLLEESSVNKEHIQFLKRIENSVLAIQKQIEFTRNFQDLGNHIPDWQNVHELFIKAKHPNIGDITCNSEVQGLELYANPLLKNVFFALIDNSIRQGENVTEVSLSYHKLESGLALIYEDNGTGIQTTDKENIFKRGFGKNTGEGLFFAKEILSLAGITIHENGESQKGARFEIIVPDGGFRIREKLPD